MLWKCFCEPVGAVLKCPTLPENQDYAKHTGKEEGLGDSEGFGRPGVIPCLAHRVQAFSETWCDSWGGPLQARSWT